MAFRLLATRGVGRALLRRPAQAAFAPARRQPSYAQRMFSSGEEGGGTNMFAIGGIVLVVGSLGMYQGNKLRENYSGSAKVEVAKQQSVALKEMVMGLGALSDLVTARDFDVVKCREAVTQMFGGKGTLVKTSEIDTIPIIKSMQGADGTLDLGAIFDMDGNGTIDTDEFIFGFCLLMILSRSKQAADTPAERARVAGDMFTVIDANNDGMLSMKELQSFIRAAKAMGLLAPKFLYEDMSMDGALNENMEAGPVGDKVEKQRSDLEVANLLMSTFDADKNSMISLAEFVAMGQQFDYAHFFKQ